MVAKLPDPPAPIAAIVAYVLGLALAFTVLALW